MSNRLGREQRSIPTTAAMAGVLALLVDEREHRVSGDRDAAKTEILLAKAGLSVEDITAVTGKSPDAIRKAIQRARAR